MEVLKIKGFKIYLLIVFINAFIDLGHKVLIQNAVYRAFWGTEQISLIALSNALLLIPFILFMTPSGLLADKFPKNKVIKVTMYTCILIAISITLSYQFGWFWFSFFVSFLLSMQSAFFSPAQFGYIKEIAGKKNLTQANALVQIVAIVSIMSTILIYGLAFEALVPKGIENINQILTYLYPLGIILVFLAFLQAIASHALPTKREKNLDLKLNLKKYFALAYIKDNLKAVKKNDIIWLSVVGLAVFWAVNNVVLSTFGSYLKDVAGVTNTFVIQSFLAIGGIGVMLGSYYIGKISKNYIEVGAIPLATIGMAFCLFILPNTDIFYNIFNDLSPTMIVSLMAFFFLLYGIFGAMFIVPLHALIQFNAKDQDTGQILAGRNFIQNLTMITFLVITIFLTNRGIASPTIFRIIFYIAIIGAFYTLYKMPQAFIRYLVRTLLDRRYNLQVIGIDNIPADGGVLLLGNHTSFLDWALLQMASPRPLRFVMARDIYEKWYLKWFLNWFGCIPISNVKSKEALEKATDLLKKGEALVIFPEGQLSRNGQLAEFHKGFEIVAQNSSAQIVPFYIRGLWGSFYSYATPEYRSSSKLRRQRDVTVCFGKVMPSNSDAIMVKDAVAKLSIYTWQRYTNIMKPVQRQWFRQAKKLGTEISLIDYDETKFSAHRLLISTIIFAKKLKTIVKKEARVGIILPTSAFGIISNLATLVLNKTVVNLNYTASPKIIEKCIKKAKLKTIITSKTFLNKLANKGFNLEEVLADKKVVYLENLKEKVSILDKLITALAVKILPVQILEILYLKKASLDDIASIIFSSGSEGDPKGVMLSHRNIIGNIKQIVTVVNPRDNDVLLNNLPLFHAFGFTVTTLMPLSENIPLIAIPDPTDVNTIAKLSARYKPTVMFGTSTFLNIYARSPKIHPLMFQSLRLVVAGAEKLKETVKLNFKNKFNLDILEGYGTTETTPVASTNLPDVLIPENLKIQIGTKTGSVGLPLPGSAFKIVDPVNLTELKTLEQGLILIGGTQIMVGYLDDLEKTKNAIVEIDDIRWYKSGDKGFKDADGFLTIVDRYARFAKIGGEMISLTAVEAELSQIINDENIELIAVNLEDYRKGEKIIVLMNCNNQQILEYFAMLKAKISNNLFLPEKIISVENIPKLGSGKLDFAGAKKIARDYIVS